MLFWTGFRRVLSEASSHFIWTLCRNSPTDQCVQRPFPQRVKSIIDSHLKEEALLTVHSRILNRLRPPYLVVVSDSNNNTGNCSARKLSIRWWSESVMRQFSRIERKGNLLLLDNKRTETPFPSYISHFIPLNLSLTFWVLEKVLILQVSAICMLIFTYLQKPQFWINKTAGDNKVVMDYEQPLVIMWLFLFRGKNSDIKKKWKLLTPYHLPGLCLR